MLAELIGWCARCRIPEFIKLGRTPCRDQKLITNALRDDLSNALSEATNTHLRGLTKRAYEFHTPDALLSHKPCSPEAAAAHHAPDEYDQLPTTMAGDPCPAWP